VKIRRRTGRAASCVAVAAAVGILAGPAALADGSGQDEAAIRGPVVLIGVGGLRWSDIDAQETPTLWGLVGQGSVGSISVRTVKPVTCPIDAWLTLSAGQRALGSPSSPPSGGPTPATSTGDDASCPPLPAVRGTTVGRWQYFKRLQGQEISSYGEPGVLGDGLRKIGVCGLAVGPGAAVALADTAGQVSEYARGVADADLAACPVAVIDGGDLPAAGIDRLTTLHNLDTEIATVVDELPADAELLIAGIADSPNVKPGLQVAIQLDPDSSLRAWLTSNSTRRTGLIQLTDLTATLLARVGAPVTDVDGATVLRGDERRIDTQRTIDNRLDLSVLTEEAPRIAHWLAAAYAAVQVLVYGGVGWSARRRSLRKLIPALSTRNRRIVIATAVGAAATPVATYLATLTSWWTSPIPGLALLSALIAIITVVTFAAWRQPTKQLRAEIWAPALTVSALTFGVLTVDALLGTPLQLGSLLVSGPVNGGRFFGFNNTTFAVYVASALVLSGCLAEIARRQGRPQLAIAIVAVIGLVAIVIEGWPSFGADFGGVVSMVPGFAVLGMELAGVRITLKRLAVIGLAGFLLAATIAALDWLRPTESQTHLGRFVQRVVDGDATDIVLRKASGALDTVTNPAGVVVLLASAIAIAVVLQVKRFEVPALTTVYQRWQTSRPMLHSVALVAVLGSVTNDSGVVVAGAMLLTTAPLILVACLKGSGSAE
jgi:hypothetical protein